jgi:hypothetical protein
MAPPTDTVAQRADLERQLALLLPVVQHLRVEVAPGRLVLDDQWTGEAARAAAELVAELERRLALAADGVDDLVRQVRLVLGGLP